MSFGVVGKGKKLSNRNILRSPTAVSHPEQRLSYVTLFCISSRFSLKHRGSVNSCDPPMSPFDNGVLLEVLELHTQVHTGNGLIRIPRKLLCLCEWPSIRKHWHKVISLVISEASGKLLTQKRTSSPPS